MKKVLITGKNSYLGSFVRRELEKDPQAYQVTELDMTDPKWTDFSFAGYDAVYHVAGLAHSTPDESQRDFYYQINTELAYQTALKASQEGVKQFIFMSSIIVYSSGEIGRKRTITKNTPLTPDNFYGDSKKQAEIKIRSIESDMKVVILRPPMIYGPNSKGNYPLLAKFARKTPVFPTLKNERSMLFVGNLVQFIQKVIDQELEGIFLPQSRFVFICNQNNLVCRFIERRILYVQPHHPSRCLCGHCCHCPYPLPVLEGNLCRTDRSKLS